MPSSICISDYQWIVFFGTSMSQLLPVSCVLSTQESKSQAALSTSPLCLCLFCVWDSLVLPGWWPGYKFQTPAHDLLPFFREGERHVETLAQTSASERSGIWLCQLDDKHIFLSLCLLSCRMRTLVLSVPWRWCLEQSASATPSPWQPWCLLITVVLGSIPFCSINSREQDVNSTYDTNQCRLHVASATGLPSVLI